MKKHLCRIVLFLMIACPFLTGCELAGPQPEPGTQPVSGTELTAGTVSASGTESAAQSQSAQDESSDPFDLSAVPDYGGTPYYVVNENVPLFTAEELTTESYEYYSELDALGRCGVTMASIGQDLMPTEERGDIGSVKPTGWHTVKYDCVDGKYLYNRCHLIGFQLTGENANPQNLITGTRYLNVEGMLPFENMVADYIKETGNHVLYRVTPVYKGDDLVARGVLMEAESVEDAGEGILFYVFCYNVQPGIVIDYATGESGETEIVSTESVETTYILNTGTKKFHIPSCNSVDGMKEENKQTYTGSREEVISMGYEPCKNCAP